MWSNPQCSVDLVTFTEEILNQKLHSLCSVVCFGCFSNYCFKRWMKYSVTPGKLFALWNLLTFWKLTHCLIFKAAVQRCSLEKVFWKYATKSQEYTHCWSAISVKQQKNFVEITLRHGCSPANLLHVFRTTFLKNLYGWLLLDICTSQASSTFSKMSFSDFPWVMLSYPSNWLARFKIFAMPFILLTLLMLLFFEAG